MQLATVGETEVRRSINILRTLLGPAFARDFDLEFWDGTRIRAREAARFTLAINAPFALRAAFLPPIDLNPGRAYVEKWIDIQGDAEAAVDVLTRAIGSVPSVKMPLLLSRLLALPKPPPFAEQAPAAELRGARHSKKRDAAAIGFHYDQPIEYYRSFLDERMVYSCAYFDDGIETLEGAQIAKIDYILKKIGLEPGEELLDIGCGWGALVLRAASKFGAKCVGVTLSQNQFDLATARVKAAGLEDRIEIRLQDYRDVEGQFDRITSVGMFEHVGRKNLPGYFQKIHDLLVDDGIAMNHGITSSDSDSGETALGGGEFIDRYVFPDGELPHISLALESMQRGGLEAVDVESLRRHYAHTLDIWAENFETHAEEARKLVDDEKFRIWRVYLAGCAYAFENDDVSIYQVVCRKAGRSAKTLPWSRRYMYERQDKQL
jgi:cyclopropane-fatty-acyl-phospholipid synthase